MAPREFTPRLITLVFGVGATLTWQTHGRYGQKHDRIDHPSPNKQQFQCNIANPMNQPAGRWLGRNNHQT
jgi:hypothetical protein